MCHLQITPFLKALLHVEHGNGLSRVGPFMHLQMTSLIECLVTFGTGKCLLSCVGLFIRLQITTLPKCLVTFGTGNCFSPVLLLSCSFNLQFSAKDLSYFEQANNFSPVCIISCVFNPSNLILGSIRLTFATFCSLVINILNHPNKYLS